MNEFRNSQEIIRNLMFTFTLIHFAKHERTEENNWHTVPTYCLVRAAAWLLGIVKRRKMYVMSLTCKNTNAIAGWNVNLHPHLLCHR